MNKMVSSCMRRCLFRLVLFCVFEGDYATGVALRFSTLVKTMREGLR